MQNITNIQSRVQQLRNSFQNYQIKGYIVPSNDEYMNEYTPAFAKRLQYITGFTGSSGIAIILESTVLLFTDGRYIEQARKELPQNIIQIFNQKDLQSFNWGLYLNLEDTAIIPNPRLNQTNGFESEAAQTYMKYVRKAESRKVRLDHLKMGLGIRPLQKLAAQNQMLGDLGAQNRNVFDIHEDLSTKSTTQLTSAVEFPKQYIGYDPKLFTPTTLKNFASLPICTISNNLIDAIWHQKPTQSKTSLYLYDDAFSGLDYQSKKKVYLDQLNIHQASALCITSLDSICWALNLRGHDIEFSTIFCAKMIATSDHIYVFTDTTRIDDVITNQRPDIHFIAEDQFDEFISQLTGKVLIDARNTSKHILSLLKACVIHQIDDPIQLSKAVKNPIEITNAVQTHIKDGIAVCEFLSVMQNFDGYTEYELGLKLSSFRAKQSGYIQDSFPNICGFQNNSSIIHYRAPKNGSKLVSKPGILLIDSGGHYFGGTTDVTRTIAIGVVDSFVKKRYTQVLKGHIALALIKFPIGICGKNLDILARQYLWSEFQDYNHGTGHGVGSCLNVHEGPQGINLSNNVPLLEGMIVSNEPGFYLEDHFGIRIENMMYVKKCAKNWLCFEQLTLVPYDRNLIDWNLITTTEKDYIQSYYNKIMQSIYPLVSDDCKQWLHDQTLI